MPVVRAAFAFSKACFLIEAALRLLPMRSIVVSLGPLLDRGDPVALGHVAKERQRARAAGVSVWGLRERLVEVAPRSAGRNNLAETVSGNAGPSVGD